MTKGRKTQEEEAHKASPSMKKTQERKILKGGP
jgi:hypothetical protein